MRITKKYDIRLNEILDASEFLFIHKGYEQTTINDILEKVAIGKGTFYHYFKSKEEVMKAVIERITAQVVNTISVIADDKQLCAQDKMKAIVLSLNISHSPSGAILKELHRPSNAQMHQNSIVETIQTCAPILANVVKQGITEGCYNTPYPLESIEFLLAANQTVFDDGIFQWNEEELTARAVAFVYNIELILGAPKGSFAFILDTLKTQKGDTLHDKYIES